MKIGIVSDTHGNLSGLLDLVGRLQDEVKVDKIFHLGGNYADVDEFISLRRSLLKGSTEYSDSDFLSDVSHFVSQTVGDSKPDPRTLLSEDEIARLRRIIVRVPEPDNPLAVTGRIPKTAIEMIENKIILLVHNVKTLAREDIEGADIVVYGGTRHSQVDALGGRWFINPGHFMEGSDGGRPPSYALLEGGPGGFRATICRADGTEVASKDLTFGPRTKMTVK